MKLCHICYAHTAISYKECKDCTLCMYIKKVTFLKKVGQKLVLVDHVHKILLYRMCAKLKLLFKIKQENILLLFCQFNLLPVFILIRGD